MEEKKQVETTEQRPKQDSITVTSKGKNTRNIPEVVFIVCLCSIRKKLKSFMKNLARESTRK